MKTKHTQGTWHSHDGQIYTEETGKTICLIPYYDKDNEEQQANAKLIEAAPKLLFSLQMLINDIHRNDGDIINRATLIKEANEAINQATI